MQAPNMGGTARSARIEVTQAFQYGLIIFTLTALLGLANATQLFGALDRNTLLTHLHSGTLGWITMGVIGIAIWIFARADEDLAAPVMLSALSTAAYVMAFWSGVYILRGVFGLSELAVIVYWWWFVYTRAGGWAGIRRLDIPKLSVVLGLTTLVVGSTLGVTVQVLLATGNVLLIAGTLLVSYPAFYLRARAEERLLRDRFGAEYDKYAREVPMLVPMP